MDKGSIIIVDDDADYCCLLQMALLDAHVSNPIEMFHDGASAIHHLEKLRLVSNPELSDPTLLLLDLVMPGTSGLEVLKWIRAQTTLANVPVVVFTGMEIGDELARAVEAGATSVHVKPFAYRDLVQEAQNLRDNYLTSHEYRFAA